MSEWISVNTRLPCDVEGPYHYPCLIYGAYQDDLYKIMMVKSASFFKGLGKFMIMDREMHVTHWMPLPMKPASQ